MFNNIFDLEILSFLTDPKTSFVFASGSTMVSAVIQLNIDVSCSNHKERKSCLAQHMHVIILTKTFLHVQGTIMGGIKSASYSLSSSSIDGIEESPSNMLFVTSFMQSTNTITMNVSQPLPRRRLWNYQVLAMGCQEHPLANSLKLSKSSQSLKLIRPQHSSLLQVLMIFKMSL